MRTTMGERLRAAEGRLGSAMALEIDVCKAVLSWLPAGKAAVVARDKLRQAESESKSADGAFFAACAEIAKVDPELGADMRAIGPSRMLAEVDGDTGLIKRARKAAEAACRALEARRAATAASSAAHTEGNRLWGDVLRAHDRLLIPSPEVYAVLSRLFEMDGRGRVAPPTNPEAVENGIQQRLKALGAQV